MSKDRQQAYTAIIEATSKATSTGAAAGAAGRGGEGGGGASNASQLLAQPAVGLGGAGDGSSVGSSGAAAAATTVPPARTSRRHNTSEPLPMAYILSQQPATSTDVKRLLKRPTAADSNSSSSHSTAKSIKMEPALLMKPDFQVGHRVIAKWKGKANWFKGTITHSATNKKGVQSFDILYDDSMVERKVRPRLMRYEVQNSDES